MRRDVASEAVALLSDSLVPPGGTGCASSGGTAGRDGSEAPSGAVLAARIGAESASHNDVPSRWTRGAYVGLTVGAKRRQRLARRFVRLFCRRGGGGVAPRRDELCLTRPLLAKMRGNIASEAVALLSGTLVSPSGTVGARGSGAAGSACKVGRVGKLTHGAHLARAVCGYRACVTDARAGRAVLM